MPILFLVFGAGRTRKNEKGLCGAAGVFAISVHAKYAVGNGLGNLECDVNMPNCSIAFV